MNSILAAGLIHYWRTTGDEQAGQAVANMAANMVYDWTSPTEPGVLLSCDPLQSLHLYGYAMQDVLPFFWGYELTGNDMFLEKGADMVRESILADARGGAAFGLARYWEMQDTLYYFDLYNKSQAGD